MTTETVEILSTGIEAITPGVRWNPMVGTETERFIARLRPENQLSVQAEALTILQRCVRPGEVAQRAGLVVGYVQSGKTTSFTAVSALAADNAYGLVVILGGTSNPLLEQTRKRLAKDLQLDEPDAYRRWITIPSPQVGSNEATRLQAALAAQIDPDSDDDERVPVLVTIMKQHTHMENLAKVLEDIARALPTEQVTALIVDDEADQATPNLKKDGSESTTYSRMRRIRRALPSHTLLQYTATPQAPLLVSIADQISPEFVCTLLPGPGYTGGKFFFVDSHDDYVRHIDEEDLATIDGDGDAPPDSLLSAFAVYVLGCAVAKLSGERDPSQRSMLVHPSQRTLPQTRFLGWLKAAAHHWTDTLLLEVGDADRIDLVEQIFRPAWDELSRTVDGQFDFEAVLKRVTKVLPKTSFHEVNATAGASTQIPWSAGPYWVLVGGQLLDRGFTVEGLTVTYMPRGIGVGNADTVQQRARFFGYKAGYAKYCRMYLDPSVDAAFTSYVRHEEALRRELSTVASGGGSLKDWKRVFFLDKKFRPTRQAVMRLELASPSFRDGWFAQRDFADFSSDLAEANRDLVDNFTELLEFEPFSEASGPDVVQQHEIARVGLRVLLDDFLTNFVMWGDDSPLFTAVRLIAEEAADSADAAVVLMSPGMTDPPRRRRTLADTGKIKNLFQGQNPRSGVITYGGDRKARVSDMVTLQVHRLDLTADDGTDEGSVVTLTDVPVLAISIPPELQERVLVQYE